MWTRSGPSFLLSLALALALLGALEGVLASVRFQQAFYSRNPVSYFYISYDWRLKLSRALLGRQEGRRLFVGSSRTGYAVDPSVDPRAENFGMMAASQAEIHRLLEALDPAAPAATLFLEANPVSMSSAMIENNRSAGLSRALDHSTADRLVPLRPWLNLRLRLFSHRELVAATVARILGPSPPPESPDDTAKRRMHLKEFLWLDRHSRTGFIPGKLPAREGFQDFLFESCSTMVGWSIRPEAGFEEGEALFREGLRVARKKARRVVAWAPPLTRSLREELAPQLGRLRAISEEEGVLFLDLGSFFPEAEERARFLDCIHLNEHGAKALTQRLLGEGGP